MILNFLKGYSVDGQRRPTSFEQKIKQGIKLHTIREDATNRWKPGVKIHFSTGSRTGQYNCFKQGICNGVETIEINYRMVYINGRHLTTDEIEYLAINDGFDSVDEFWNWFDQYTPFTGKIIHWTDLRYNGS